MYKILQIILDKNITILSLHHTGNLLVTIK